MYTTPTVDLAPSLPSRIVLITAVDLDHATLTEGSVTFTLWKDVNASNGIIQARSAKTVDLVNGEAVVRLPVYQGSTVDARGDVDWDVLVQKSWDPSHPYGVRVPAGTDPIHLSDLREAQPLKGSALQYAITDVGVSVVEGTKASGKATLSGGVLTFALEVPPFAPEVVRPYVNEQVAAADNRLRADIDARLAQVTSAYDLAVAGGFSGTQADWIASLKGQPGAPGPYGGTEVVAPQLAELIDSDAVVRAALDRSYRRGYSVREFGATGDGTTDDTAAIQACADAAFAAGEDATVYIPEGTYLTTSTLRFRGGLDGSAATIRYDGPGTAVILGDNAGTVTSRRIMDAPRVVCARKPTRGWTAGTVGVLAVNLNSCHVSLPRIAGFATGLTVYGKGQGIAYNIFTLGMLENNKVNQLLDNDATGWSNQNTYLGGRYSHESAEGAVIAGVRHLQIATTANPINNNLWLNSSFEGAAPEFHADVSGSANMWVNARWENPGGARVRWRAGAVRNQILWGYQAWLISETFVDANAGSNTIYSAAGLRFTSGNPNVFENTAAIASPSDVVLAPGGTAAAADTATAYAVSRSAAATKMKRSTDAYDRVLINHQTGAVNFGTGAAPPTIGVGVAGTVMRIDSAVSTSAGAGGTAAALPAQPAGWLSVYIDGAVRKIPYY